MLKKLYVDNFRCLVNFEIEFDRLCLLLGNNGTGKTSVFDVVYGLRQFISGKGSTDQLFEEGDRTRWQDRADQTFEFDMEGNGGAYSYRLIVEHNKPLKKSRVKEEILRFNNQPIYEYRDRAAQLYRDDFSKGPEFSPDWSRSGMALLQPRQDNQKLTWFKNRLDRVILVAPQPRVMSAEAATEDSTPARDMSNFASWYRFLIQEHFGNISSLMEKLKNAIPGFRTMSPTQMGKSVRRLELRFASPGALEQEEEYGFDELSDGQRQLIALYALLNGLFGLDYSLFIDEPDNYVSLPEIQPWLFAVEDACEKQIPQVTLISHHPELINYLGGSAGQWLFREEAGPTRVVPLSESVEGLKLSEQIARGWVRE